MSKAGGFLITGSSHVGKTTLALRLAERLGWTAISTDALARHPGRPWPTLPPPVADYYDRLSPETIYWFLRVHHDNLWPLLRRRIEDALETGAGFVAEGAALRPRLAAPLLSERLSGLCLWAEAEFLRERMFRAARHEEAEAGARGRIEQFVTRSLRDNEAIRDEAREAGWRIVDAADPRAMEELFETLAEAARQGDLACDGETCP